MGFFEQIRKLNVEGYAKGGKTSGPDDGFRGGSSSKSDKKTTSMSASSKSSGKKSSASRDSGGGGFFGFTSFRDMFDGGGPGASRADSQPTRVSGSSASTRVPTPRPQTVSVSTGSGRRDVSFQDYADIARNPSGERARAIDYVSPEPLPTVTPEIEAAINEYMQPKEPTIFERGLRIMPMGGILGTLSDFTRSTIQDQLTTPVNTYEGTGLGVLGGFGDRIGQAITRPRGNVASYTPVLNANGQVIGSMSLDESGNPIGYTGTRTTNATFGDPNINQEAAMAMISPFDQSRDDSDGPVSQVAATAAPAAAAPTVDPCPEGYVLDPETQTCVPDPFSQPFQTQTPMPMVTPTLNYTAVTPIQAPTLSPGPMVPMTFQPVQQQPIGLASLNPFTS